MTHAVPVPWEVCWLGCTVAAAGLILAMSEWGQRQPRTLDRVSHWIIGVGLTLALGSLGANGVVYGANLAGDLVRTAVASAQPVRPEAPPSK
jgi:hypothetical protein